MAPTPPGVVVLAGPNGAGKTTAAPGLLKEMLRLFEFVNADTIAQGLAAFSPERVALEAAAVMLNRLRDLGMQRRSFAFETTLASRSLAPWLTGLIRDGYEFHLIYLWLPSPDLAVERVADRVRLGGHPVPEQTIRRRYRAGLRNFFNLYQPLALTWVMYDNRSTPDMPLIAAGTGTTAIRVGNEAIWLAIQEEYLYVK